MRWILVLVAGCGRLGFDDHERAAATAVDAATATAACDPAAAFGTPELIAEISDPTADDGSLRLLPDELTGYFGSFRGGVGNIFAATRLDRASLFEVHAVTGLSYTNQLDPAISADGSALLFRRSDAGDDLWMATRLSVTEFAAVTPVIALDSPASEVEPFLTLDGGEVYFASDRSGAGDIYRAARRGFVFDSPVLVDELASADVDGDPVVSADGLALYFRSSRPAALAGANIFVATRTQPADRFGAPAPVANVNSDADEGPSWLSPDGCRLYLWSDRAGTRDVYVASR